MNEAIFYTPATELASSMRSKELSPVEVVDAFLDRIHARDDSINAFITVCDQSARDAAVEAERAINRGDIRGPLHGVPVAVKDLNHVQGVRTTFGSKLFSDSIASSDDIVVQRLKAAGAIVIGKTNTSEFGRKPMTTNLLVGATSNPWDHRKTVGGSSGGSAAALAEGMVPLAHGSDAAGSLRIPASVCGVVGFMPDFGRVPLGPRDDQFVNNLPYTSYGPMARSVADAAVMLDVMAGPDPRDPYTLPDPDGKYAEAVERDLHGMNIAYTTDILDIPVADPIKEVVDEAVETFDETSATVTEISSPFSHTWEEYHKAIEVVLQTRYRGLHDNLKVNHGVDLLEHRDQVSDEVISRIELSYEINSLDICRASRMRTAAHDDMRRLLAEYDLLVTPTVAMDPFEKDTQPTENAGVEIDPLHGWVFTWPFNLTGNPAMSVPAGLSPTGLPVGLQLIGRRLADDVVIAAGGAYERETSFTEAFPPA